MPSAYSSIVPSYTLSLKVPIKVTIYATLKGVGDAAAKKSRASRILKAHGVEECLFG